MAGEYGFFSAGSGGIIEMPVGQNTAGFPIGILYIEQVHYPMLPGNVVNAYTYDFPVCMQPVEGLKSLQLFEADDSIFDMMMQSVKKLQRAGVRAITGACGFFGNFQARMAAELNIPVGLSSLIQIPWIRTLLGPEKKIVVLTASKESITDKLFLSCGLTDWEDLIIRDLRYQPEFSCILEDRGIFNHAIVREEVVAAALDAVQSSPDNIGAILLECSDMPPYAADVQRATGLPVFDFITLIRWMHSAVAQRPYQGFV